ncbi:GNAT family N-acetyltransferase [Deinococcus enclensis]|uniref:GNAT superfamily N-acetyltransferase n=1 Tax=Deinococcus enclensis TaxID=1049582 RepID=A0ABT9MD66_9DEIO|nr:GNAT family N-acetyltransferase [Deinococcus enclensis]MDP9764509.1 GNAT superfamily N-acetyltransferase [Deinococcus enclensis]
MPELRPLTLTPDTVTALAVLLTATVAAGGSVGFMHPLPPEDARAFWTASLQAAGRDERVVYGAFQDGALVGTLTLLLAFPPNQPHRAELAKMMTHPRARGQGVASALVRAAETEAARRGKTLLVLDTASEEGAGPFYEKLGYTLTGLVPDFALKPHGGLTGTLFYWKRLG